jgi:hypothetical protein
LIAGQSALAAPPPRPAHGDRARRAHDATPRLGHFGQWVAPVPCDFGPNSGLGLYTDFIFFFYRISNFRKKIGYGFKNAYKMKYGSEKYNINFG